MEYRKEKEKMNVCVLLCPGSDCENRRKYIFRCCVVYLRSHPLVLPLTRPSNMDKHMRNCLLSPILAVSFCRCWENIGERTNICFYVFGIPTRYRYIRYYQLVCTILLLVWKNADLQWDALWMGFTRLHLTAINPLWLFHLNITLECTELHRCKIVNRK